MKFHPLCGLSALLALPLALSSAHFISAAPAAQKTSNQVDQRVAWGNGLQLMRSELVPVLVRRYAMTGEGRSALDHLIQTKLLSRMAKERRMEINEKELDARIDELDARLRESGSPDGIAGKLREGGVDEAEFRALFRISIVQERLCREALGIQPDSPVDSAQQELWIEAEMKERGLSGPPPPWKDGIAGRCGDVVVTAEEYQEKLLLNLDPKQVRETCYQLMLINGIRARMPDLPEIELSKAIEIEINRRRKKAETNPAYQGASFEQLLSTQGTSLELMKSDPAVLVTALSELWVLRSHSDKQLRAAYAEERALYDGAYGESIQTHVLFLRAAAISSPANPRLFDQAHAQLEDIARKINTLGEFETAARRHSEDSKSRTNGGELGWLRRVGNGLEELRSAVFTDLKTKGPIPPTGRMLAPVRNQTGVVLVWVSDHKPAPTWEGMRERVRAELRSRFIKEVLPRESLVTILDA
ncbi:MAG: hypothetical protein ACI8TQ_001904 [Planctomycetota bacterium]